jgi:hypothetical protein
VVGWVEQEDTPGEWPELLRHRGLLIQLLLRHRRARIDGEAVAEQGRDYLVVVGDEEGFASEEIGPLLLFDIARRLLLLLLTGDETDAGY